MDDGGTVLSEVSEKMGSGGALIWKTTPREKAG
jgi:hypothetical protein